MSIRSSHPKGSVAPSATPSRAALSAVAAPARNTDRSSLCRFTFADGRQCRTPRAPGNPHFCAFHARKLARSQSADDLAREVSFYLSSEYLSANDLTTALARLIPAILRGDISPKIARTLAYHAQILAQLVRIGEHEYISAFGAESWRRALRNSVRHNFALRNPVPSTPPLTPPASVPAPAAAPAAPPDPAPPPASSLPGAPAPVSAPAAAVKDAPGSLASRARRAPAPAAPASSQRSHRPDGASRRQSAPSFSAPPPNPPARAADAVVSVSHPAEAAPAPTMPPAPLASATSQLPPRSAPPGSPLIQSIPPL
jgi:hypothetical protein